MKEDAQTRSRIMREVKSKDTTPELIVRRMVYAMGYRYRLHRKDLPGKPDLVFPKSHKALFVHGCFWHGHDCARGSRMPKTNTEYWRKKIGRNRIRDAANIAALKSEKWKVAVIWECELKELLRIQKRLARFLR
ncbi:MAG TPA: very short patch repair endonuclease [Acidobacteriaceae bacterium]|nr:very short patch repair endonuclease [Acidobacteriaceae bacterium]